MTPQGISLTRLAVRLDAPIASIQKLVNGLVALGYLAEHHHRFTLGPAPYVLAAGSGLRPIQTVGHADLTELHARTGATAVLALRVGDCSIYLDAAGEEDLLKYVSLASLRTPLPDTASGRVLLASLPADARLDCIEDLVRDTPAKVPALLDELDQINRDGYLIGDSGPAQRGIVAVAAPVWEGGRVVAAVALGRRRDEPGITLPDMHAALTESLATWSRRESAGTRQVDSFDLRPGPCGAAGPAEATVPDLP